MPNLETSRHEEQWKFYEIKISATTGLHSSSISKALHIIGK